VEGFTNLLITYAGTGSGEGTIRAANSADARTAYGLYPSVDPRGGDVFFNEAGDSPVAGNFDYTAILHELGHALGLDHGHTADNFGALPGAWDSFEFSVMTYRSAIGGSAGVITSETWGNPQTFMMLDIAALQYMYGADFTTNAGATQYSWDPATGRSFVDGALALAPGGNRILLTIWDGGGYDTYNLSNYATDLVVNLYPGGASTLSAVQLADLNQTSAGGLARGSVFNALQYRGDPRSLIEAAIGGSGNDLLIGNAAANNLFGNAGDDRLVGGHGDDRLFGQAGGDLLRGQAGTDRLVGGPGADALTGGTDPDLFVFTAISDSVPGARDVILGGDGAAAFEGAGPTWGDRIDVSALDANLLLPGNQAFGFGTATGIGRLYAVDVGLATVVRGNVNADPGPDFEVVIADGGVLASAYTLHDFVL
jgi:serralysin